MVELQLQNAKMSFIITTTEITRTGMTTEIKDCGSGPKMGRRSITFRSNLQEELSLREIMSCLLPTSASNLTEKRRILANIVDKHARITTAFAVVSRKLSYSFVYCIPSKGALPLTLCSGKDAAKVIFKLAILFDVYKRAVQCNADNKVEAVFQCVMSAVDDAKAKARRQRNEQLCRRVMGIIDSITKKSLEVSAVIECSNTTKKRNGNKVTNDAMTEEDKWRAMCRYRALVGVGDQAISKDQLIRIISDLVRINPCIQLPAATSALDEILGISPAKS